MSRLDQFQDWAKNSIHEHPRRWVAGGALIVAATVMTSYAPYDYSGTDPYWQTESGSVEAYPIFKPNRTVDIDLPGPLAAINHIQAPLVLHPTKYFKTNPLVGPGIDTFENDQPTTVTAYLIGKEEDDTRAGEVACPDGTKVPYIASGPVTEQDLRDAYCDGAVTQSKEVKKSKEIKKAAEGGAGNCAQFNDRERGLCYGRLWEKGRIFYGWGMGHVSATAFNKGCSDPANPKSYSGSRKNAPHSGPSNRNNGGLHGNGHPCAVDCSSLIEQAENMAFNYSVDPKNVAGLMTSGYMKRIKDSDAQPGDIVTRGTGHIEFVVKHVKGDFFKTFGAHKTGDIVDESSGHYDQAWRWVKTS